MRQPDWSYLLAVFVLSLDSTLVGFAFQPEFVGPIVNITVPVGRDATLRCVVQNLGGYRIGWVKADTKAIQAIHTHVITNNHRIGVSHSGQSLHIRNVQEEDRGQYMCQINTDPMISQLGNLEVVIPPDFVSEETSSDVIVPEGGTVTLSCRAKGIPNPRVSWRKEDGGDIVVRDSDGGKTKVITYENEVLILTKISRTEMGAYLCIASNGVPPSVSKRIMVKVHFHPVIQVPNQLVGAPLGTDVTLECFVESSPKSINFWVRESSEMVVSSNKYEVTNTMISSFETRMALTVRKMTAVDVGGYRCVAKNSLGEVDSVIRLYDIPGNDKSTSTDSTKEDLLLFTTNEGPDNQYGSADKSDDEDVNIFHVDNQHKTAKSQNYPHNTTNNKTSTHRNRYNKKVTSIVSKLEKNEDISAGKTQHKCITIYYMALINTVYLFNYNIY